MWIQNQTGHPKPNHKHDRIPGFQPSPGARGPLFPGRARGPPSPLRCARDPGASCPAPPAAAPASHPDPRKAGPGSHPLPVPTPTPGRPDQGLTRSRTGPFPAGAAARPRQAGPPGLRMSRGRSGRGRAGERDSRGAGSVWERDSRGAGSGWERDPAGSGHRGMGPKSKNKPGGKKAEKKEEEVKLNEGDEAEREEAARLEKERLERERLARLEAKYQEQKESELAELNSLEQKFLSAQQWKMEYREHEK
ncbi:PREDICTED: cuticle collagen 2-like, partial [Lepidothrix coronata]|uniref:Cuticle collagen 2-like n=1 Tax=Lepidothrix coronata TaxID=321398 RepID=A0A6J0ID14_9PASS